MMNMYDLQYAVFLDEMEELEADLALDQLLDEVIENR